MAKVEFEINAIDKASSILNGIKDRMIQTGGAAGIMGAAFITAGLAVATALAKAVSEAQEYDQQIKGLMVSTGGTADATSRMVQVLDDAGIEFGTVTKAMKEMAKDGTEPSIQQVAALSDQFLALETGAERGKFLLDKFGKSGLDMARAMELGGDAILKMNAAQKGGLIVTEQAIQQSEEYRKNLDELNDSWKGLKIELGNAVIPAINNAISTTKQYNQVMDDVIAKHGDAGERMNRYRTNLEMARLAQMDATVAAQSHGEALDGTLTPAIIAATDATAAMVNNNQDLLGLIGTMQNAEDSYAENHKSITEDMSLTDDERKVKLGELAAEYDMTSKRIILGLLEQQLAQDGLTNEELDFLLRKGEAWGIYSAGVVEDARIAMREVEGITRALNAIPENITSTVTIRQVGAAAANISYELGTQLGYRAAGGPVNAGSAYMVGERGPEMIVPGSSGTVIPNNQLGGGMDMKLLARTIVSAMQAAG